MMCRSRVLQSLSAIALLCLAGCGGGGSQAFKTPLLSDSQTRASTHLVVTINWAARGRVVSTSSSVTSVAITLKGANANGADFIYKINRDLNTSATSTQTYTSP